ncbi:hypothetical protein EBU94_04890 [bacterium]|jgi:hypothetical protein|nr:hypothetical protein [bacterium]
MSLIKIERDTVLDKIYELRGKIDPTDFETMQKVTELIDMIVYAPESETQAAFPKIRIRR